MTDFAKIPSGSLIDPLPFLLNIPDHDLEEFKELLRLSKLAPLTWESTKGNMGLQHAWLSDARHRWLNLFDWRVQEKLINSFPNFIAELVDPKWSERVSIHFAALFSTKEDAIPIVFLHGWPGSFIEFIPMMSLLREKYEPSTLPWHIIVPSLPGYTFSSGPPVDRDYSTEDAGRIIDILMAQLGFGQSGYLVQGGDVGAIIAGRMSISSNACKAIHVNLMMLLGEELNKPWALTEEEIASLREAAEWNKTSMGYSIMHATRPATIGLVLASNPLATLAWIGEKMLEWADRQFPLDMDKILTMATLYWLTNTIHRCPYHYREFIKPTLSMPPMTKTKPLGYSRFPREKGFLPDDAGKHLYPNMIRRYEHTKGGHFAAWEQPSLFLGDIEDFAKAVYLLFKE